MTGIRFDAFCIFVSDLREMVRFYRDVIGVDIEWDGEGPHVEFKHEGIRFLMFERRQLPSYLGTEVSFPAGINGTFELAVDLSGFSDVDKEFERVIKSGARPAVSPRNEPWGMRTSYVTDPENNLIEIGSWGKGEPKGD